MEISVADATASAPVELLDVLIQMLKASVAMIDAEGAHPARGRRREPTRSQRPADVPGPPARPSARQASTGTAKSARYRRKSRKPVAPAIIGWMEANPGWKSEAALLTAVVDNQMTDANPKRALMIALGKARGTTFESDDLGHWKLVADDAGPPPRRKAKKTSGAKSRTRRTKRTAKKGGQPARRGRKRLGLLLVDWMELNPGWRHLDDLLAAVVENEMTDANPSLALKITLGKGVGKGLFETDGDDSWRLVGDTTGGSVEKKAVLVKRGEKRKATPAKRWSRADDNAVDRARKNLLGLSKAAE